MLQIGKSILVIVNWRADYARTYKHEHEEPICLTCGTLDDASPYSSVCASSDHQRHQVSHVTKEERAPLEAKEAHRLYSKLYYSFHKLAAMSCGEQVYLLGANADLEGTKTKLREMFAAANEGFQHVRVGFDLKEIVLVPGEINEETLKSLKHDVENTIGSLIEALRNARHGDKESLKAIRQAGKAAEGLSSILEGDSKLQAKELAGFAKNVIERLKRVSDESTEAVEKVIEDSKNGAARFAAIFAEEEAESSRPEAA